MIYLDIYTGIRFINLRSNLHHWGIEISICIYIFCSVAVFNIPEQNQKAGSSTRSPPTASVSAYLAVMRRKAQGFFHYHAIQRPMWQSRAQSSSAHECTRKQWGTFSSLEPHGLIFNERVVVSRPRDQSDRLWGWEGLWPRMDHRVFGLAHAF